MIEPVPEREIFKIVEQMPLFPGAACGDIDDYAKRKECADQALLEYIYDRVKYPEAAKEKGIDGMTVVSFVVEPHGVMSNIELVRDPGDGLGEAALRVVEQMKADNTRWEPGLQKMRPVRVQFNLPVLFKLE